MSCSDPTFNQTLCQNVTNAGNVRKDIFGVKINSKVKIVSHINDHAARFMQRFMKKL